MTPLIENGYRDIASQWKDPNSLQQHSFNWPEDLSGNIKPVPVHSHNDYDRRVPLFDALSVGCESVEADVWLQKDNELFVGHTEGALDASRTLDSLYIDPLLRILDQQNKNLPAYTRANGVFSMSPNKTLVLLIDMKTDGRSTYPVVKDQLRPLLEKGYLTTYNGTDLVPGPITIVGTGNTPFESILNDSAIGNATAVNRFIFYDAPLDSLSPVYNTTNSYYASVQMSKSIGKVWLGKLNAKQFAIVDEQTQTAAGLSLKARYWDTTSWPVGWRNNVWTDLVNNGIGKETQEGQVRGLINADDLVAASRWDWNACSVLGLAIC